MIKHVLLIAVLEEMERLELKLGVLFEKRPEDWEEIYAATRRQIQLCMVELVKLAQDDLDMSQSDAAHLGAVFESFRDTYAGHVKRWPLEGINLADPVCVEAFHRLRNESARFKSVLYDLVDRYQIKEENT